MRLKSWLPAWGGHITQDLHIINAFAAELNAEAAVKLAQSSAVRWVSRGLRRSKNRPNQLVQKLIPFGTILKKHLNDNNGTAGLEKWTGLKAILLAWARNSATFPSLDLKLLPWGRKLFLPGSTDPSQQIWAARAVNLSNESNIGRS